MIDSNRILGTYIPKSLAFSGISTEWGNICFGNRVAKNAIEFNALVFFQLANSIS